jgi:hypothetical protein
VLKAKRIFVSFEKGGGAEGRDEGYLMVWVR